MGGAARGSGARAAFAARARRAAAAAPAAACAAAVAALLPRGVRAHGSLVMPLPRNAIDATLPEWAPGRHPTTGSIEPYSCACVNGTLPGGGDAPCDSGQACFWFSQGCGIGCDACDAQGQRFPGYDHCPETSVPPRLNDPRYRTANQDAKPGAPDDVWRFNPWRAPGLAPVADSCGMAGGSPVEVFNAGAYNATRYAKQGDLGSKVLAPRPTGTVWELGGVARARWQQTAAHGGGYQYRLCPAGEALTEECFRRTPLEWARPTKHTAVLSGGRAPRTIEATLVPAAAYGGDSDWMRNPLPYYTLLDCDIALPASEHCDYECPGCGPPRYAADGACPIRCADAYPSLPNRTFGSDPARFPDPLPGIDQTRDVAIEDELRVPAHLAPGDYVLQWRWDAELTSQIWTSCSDITLSAPTPAGGVTAAPRRAGAAADA